MDGISPAELVARLRSEEDGVRKMAVFKLQTAIADPSFADVFAIDDGTAALKDLCMSSSGNTLAYSLTSFANLLDIDKGWEQVDQEFLKRAVQLVVEEPLVNILRGAMSILVAIVQHTSSVPEQDGAETFGFKALKPVTQAYPQFLEMLVTRLSSADHALCANALQLINSLMRDAVTTGGPEWPKFIKRVQDLGVIRAVYTLMQSSALQDLAQPLLEFQTLTKLLLRKWRDVAVETKRPEHQRAVKGIREVAGKAIELEGQEEAKLTGKPRQTVSKAEPWRRLGFAGEHIEPEFEEVGFLGMMDLADYVRKNEDGFEKLLLEQGIVPPEQRCPMARASIAVTAVLYEHFEIDKPDLEDIKEYLALDSRNSVDRLFKPMLLQWSKLHTAGLQAFCRLWKATGAQLSDFDKVSELVRILIDQVVGGAVRTKEISTIEEEIATFDCQNLRELQMELVELAYEDSWGEHLKQVREELQYEALLFIKEQRVRCMLAGSWFPKRNDIVNDDSDSKAQWRFARLSHNRRWLHYGDFEHHSEEADPTLDELPDKIDLQAVSSVISNVCASPLSPASSTATLQPPASSNQPTSKIVINTVANPSSSSKQPQHHKTTSDASASSQRQETPLLTLFPANPVLASEWLDGLLMLLDQSPITDETKRLLSTVSSWGLKIRLLNVSFDDASSPGGLEREAVDGKDRGVVPSREGLDEDYYYDVFGGA